jgi:thiol-disulfide isomerase/thioredoxin
MWTNAYCATCKLLKPTFELLKRELPKIDFMLQDTDLNRAEAAVAKVLTLPSTIFYRDGVEVGRLNGDIPLRRYRDAINNLFGIVPMS